MRAIRDEDRLVLGAGGVTGQAYQAGVLYMLQNDHGLDARDVDVIVGTSAGAITGMLLRLDVSAEDLAAWADVQWPERDLWIPAVRRRDGRRVVFGRTGTPPAPRGLAVAVVRGARLFRSGAHR